MFAVRLLSGQQAGQIFMLKEGLNVLGRATSCDIKLLSPSVSKEHLSIEVFGDKIIVADMNSRNGTFVNGVQIKSTRIKPGDRVGVHDLIFEVIPAHSLARVSGQSLHGGMARPHDHAIQGNLAYQMSPPQDQSPTTEELVRQEGLASFFSVAQKYLENVLLPGVYQLPTLLEFKWVLALLMAAFILLTTSLSTIPLIRILRAGIEGESQQHALTIAATLARLNRQVLMQGVDSALTIEPAMRRPGVKQAFIVSNDDGNIMAPASQAGSFPDIPFVHEARKSDKESVKQIDGDTIVAVVPIEFYNSESGTYSVRAHAVVLFDMATQAIDSGKTISLFVQTLFIALILGSILYFFIYKLIEYPIRMLNQQIDVALREGTDQVKVDYDFPDLQKLGSNIGSALSRIGQNGGSGAQSQYEHDRRAEMGNLIQLIGYGAMIVQAIDRSVVAMNDHFSAKVGLRPDLILNQPVSSITDQALKLSLMDLMSRMESSPESLATNELEFGGNNHQIAGQAVYGNNRIAYFIFVIIPLEGGG